MRFDWMPWLPVLVIVAGLAVYANSFAGVFVFDDSVHIIQNERIRDLSALPKVLSGRRPVVDFTLAVNYALDELTVRGYHAVNVAIHIAAALILYGVVRRTLQRKAFRDRFSRSSSWLALVIASIWVVHPLQTQSVTYMIQRAESLMGLFYLLTLYCVIRGVESSRSTAWFTLAVCACAAGMGSKAVMVTAPVLVLLYDRVFVGRSLMEILRRRWGVYAGLAAIWSVLGVTGIAQGVLDSSRTSATVGLGFKGITPFEYALTQFGALVHYLRLSFWPHPLCLDYNWPLARTAGEIVPPALVILALLSGTIWALRRKPWVGFLGAWFFGILAPTSTVIPIKDVLFEHRMYLPLAAVIVLFVTGGNAALRRLAPTAAVRGLLAAILVITVVASLGHGTIRRNRVYHSAESLWRDVIATRPDNARAYENLGTVLMVKAKKKNDLSERVAKINTAIQAYRRAVQLDPDFVSARANLANALSLTGQFQEAVPHYDEVLRVEPFHADAHINRAHALDRMRRTEEAIEAYRAATRLKPPNVTPRFLARAHANLGGVLANQGDLDGAIAEYREAVRLWPRYDFAHYWWGVVLSRKGRLDEAIEHYRETLAINENHDAARQALEQALARKQRSNPD